VQQLLRQNGTSEPELRNSSSALLKGLLFCCRCRHAMTPAHSITRHKKYHYYVCTTKQKLGAKRCSSRTLPAQVIEDAVLEQLRTLALNPKKWFDYLIGSQPVGAAQLAERVAEKAALDKELVRLRKEVRCLAKNLTVARNGSTHEISQLGDLQEQVV